MDTQTQSRARSRRGQAGLSLVELIMATMVFTIGMVAVLGSLVGIMNHHRLAVTKNSAYIEIQNQLAILDGAITSANVGTFDINNPAAISLSGLPGSTVELYIVNPDAVGGPELILLPDGNFATNFPAGAPDPMEIVMEALVPSTNDVNNDTFYRFRMSALF